MKRYFSVLLSAGVGFLTTLPIFGANPSPEAEMRSTWIATVYSIDWPRVNDSAMKISSTGNQRQIDLQKKAMTDLLDSLAINNFNAAKLQIRSKCDALYKSSYEPWSSDIVTRRGMDPGYDPFEFFVEECHKRGLEAHAWVNPYRYETSIGANDGTPHAYREEHPDWLLDVGSASILNPALPEVRKRICDIVAEIVTNYDLDGLLFDDYFYLQGVSTQDESHYAAYTAAGGKLGLKDWRRENINAMVRDVYATIKSIKPWVRFGVGPAGITCTTDAQAKVHGVPRCTSGSDYQYDGIYSDPLAWLEDKSVDYISPQIYWGIGYENADFDIISKWWSDRMPSYRRHLFISKDISSLSKTGDWKVPPIQNASGPGVTTFDQYRQQIEMTRAYSTDGEPGSVFYSAKFIYSAAPLFGHFLHTNVYARKALLPSMAWIPARPQSLVEDLSLNGTTLSWKAVDGLRYAVFGHENGNREVLGFTYGNSAEIPEKYASSGTVSVAPYDRYGNVYALRTVGADLTTLDKTSVNFPKNYATVGYPFDFEWDEITGADFYILEVAKDISMDSLIVTRRVDGATTINSSILEDLPFNRRLYVRVTPMADNALSGPSNVVPFSVYRPKVTYPANDSIIDTLNPTIQWDSFNGSADIELAEDADFNNLVFRFCGFFGSYNVQKYTLQSNHDYWVRVIDSRDGKECTSDAVHFRTPSIEEKVPEIGWPLNDNILMANDHLAISPLEGFRTARIEVAASETFPSRALYIANLKNANFSDTKEASEIKIAGKNLVDGQTYFVRARATYNTVDGGSSNTAYSPIVSFKYSAERWGGIDDIESDALSLTVNISGNYLKISGIRGTALSLTDISGRVVNETPTLHWGESETTLPLPSAGVYLVSDGLSTVKIVVN